MQKKSFGFTLIELMTVIAIVGIIMAIAIPAYSQQVRKTRRAEATSRLQQIAIREEKFRAENPAYTTDWTRLGGNPEDEATANSAIFYNWAVAVTAPAPGVLAAFTITATAQGDQTSDTGCATLTINSAGIKGPAACWK